MKIIGEYARTIILVLLIVVPFRTFAYNQYYVPSGSMVPTLVEGDHVGVSMFAYGFGRYALPFDIPLWNGRWFAKSPERGDVAVFQHPTNERIDLIKRIVALPGDTVQMVDGQLILNGKPTVSANHSGEDLGKDSREFKGDLRFFEDQIGEKKFYSADDGISPFDKSAKYTVPKGHFFAMGDNRDNSLDSRYHGYFDQDLLIGRAEVVLASRTNVFKLRNPLTWIPTFRNRFFVDL